MSLIELSQSVQSRAFDICTSNGQLNIQRLSHVYAGVLAECLIDFGSVFEETSFCLRRISQEICPNLDVMPGSKDDLPSPLTVDLETELGRALSRIYLDGSHGSARSLVTVVETLVADVCMRQPGGAEAMVDHLHYMAGVLDLAVITEHATHQLCDDLIEVNIARQGWTLGDCIQGLSALSGRRLALCDMADIKPFNLQDLTRIMGQEALRLGVQADFDMGRGLAANDSQSKLPLGLVGALEPMCLETLNRYNFCRIVDQAAVLSKAAGRMIAVASSGDMPEIEAVVARPIALSAMTNAYHKFSG